MSARRSMRPPSTASDNLAAPSPQTVQSALDWGSQRLLARSGSEARREALYLLAGVLATTPGRLALESDRQLTANELQRYEEWLIRRARGEPLQYIEGRAAFRELHLRVNRSVLIPRPETEQLVEHVLEWCRGRPALRALDLGTGSGAIAISLALEGPFEQVVGVDISAEALNVARENAAEAGLAEKIDLRRGSLFGALRQRERFHVIVSNPPYVARAEASSLPREVRDWEPDVALYAGPKGTEVIERIVDGAPPFLHGDGLLALEVAPDVAAATVERIRMRGAYGEPRVLRDLAGCPRFVLASAVSDTGMGRAEGSRRATA